jgi:hypothetical protein
MPLSHIDFELGARGTMWPSVFAALGWTPEFTAGAFRVFPFTKTYVESGLGIGVTGGLAFELEWSVGRAITELRELGAQYRSDRLGADIHHGLCTRSRPGAALR